ncbi:hypothetical protein GR268_44025, partial [Rhizobium leguminosarum]|nr:hypothetical protein [Rhizobium leguminosarum]
VLTTVAYYRTGEIHVKIKKQSSLGKLVAHLQPADDWSDDDDEEESESDVCTAHLKPMEGDEEEQVNAVDGKAEAFVSDPKKPHFLVGNDEEERIGLPLGHHHPPRHLLDSASDVEPVTEGSVEEEIGFEGELSMRPSGSGRPRPRMARQDSTPSDVGSMGRSTSSYDDIFHFEVDDDLGS